MTQTSEADAYYIKYKNPLYEAQHLENVDSVYRAADSVYVHPERLMKQMFRDSVYVEKHVDAVKLMMDLFELHGISQSSYNLLPKNSMICGSGIILNGITKKGLLR